jgi:hypothetical protein
MQFSGGLEDSPLLGGSAPGLLKGQKVGTDLKGSKP